MQTELRTVLTLGEDLDIGLAGVRFADGDFKHGFDLAIEEVKERYGDGLIIPLADGQHVVVEKGAAEAAGQELWERTRLLRVTELNDVAWGDLSPVRQIELMEEAVGILRAAFPAGIVVEEPYDSIERAEAAESTGIPLTGGEMMFIRKGDDISVTTRRRKEPKP